MHIRHLPTTHTIEVHREIAALYNMYLVFLSDILSTSYHRLLRILALPDPFDAWVAHKLGVPVLLIGLYFALSWAIGRLLDGSKHNFNPMKQRVR